MRPVSAISINKMIKNEDMFEAYFACRKNKRCTSSALKYEVDYESNLIKLTDKINNGIYYPTTSICFVATRPRYREVFAASFEDRIIHHYVSLRLEPLFEKIFNDRTFNCRKGKGQLYGINVLKGDLIECSNNYTEDCYILKLDLKSFFMSIDKFMLSKMIDDFIVENYFDYDKEALRDICRIIILHEPEKDCERRSPLSFWDYLPKDKSLFTNGEGKGVAIGNLFAQHFANFLLNELDWFIEELGITHHGRYVDDFYMIHEDKEVLLSAIPEIRKMLSGIGISLNEKKFYLQHYAKGVKFTGAIVKPYRTYCGKRTVFNFKQAVKDLNGSATVDEVLKNVCRINSYLGFLRQHAEYNNRKKTLKTINKNIFKYVYIKGRYEVLAVKNKYKYGRKHIEG